MEVLVVKGRRRFIRKQPLLVLHLPTYSITKRMDLSYQMKKDGSRISCCSSQAGAERPGRGMGIPILWHLESNQARLGPQLDQHQQYMKIISLTRSLRPPQTSSDLRVILRVWICYQSEVIAFPKLLRRLRRKRKTKIEKPTASTLAHHGLSLRMYTCVCIFVSNMDSASTEPSQPALSVQYINPEIHKKLIQHWDEYISWGDQKMLQNCACCSHPCTSTTTGFPSGVLE